MISHSHQSNRARVILSMMIVTLCSLWAFQPTVALEPGGGKIFLFNGDDGITPNNLMIHDGRVYGTARGGGAHEYGTMFSLDLDGHDFTIIRHFDAEHPCPEAGAIIYDGILYGTMYGETHRQDMEFDRGGATVHKGRLYFLKYLRSGFPIRISLDGAKYERLITEEDAREAIRAYGQENHKLGDDDWSWGLGGWIGVIDLDRARNQVDKPVEVLHAFPRMDSAHAAQGVAPYHKPIVVYKCLVGDTRLGGRENEGVIYSLSLVDGTYRVVHKFATQGGAPFPDHTLVPLGKESVLWGNPRYMEDQYAITPGQVREAGNSTGELYGGQKEVEFELSLSNHSVPAVTKVNLSSGEKNSYPSSAFVRPSLLRTIDNKPARLVAVRGDFILSLQNGGGSGKNAGVDLCQFDMKNPRRQGVLCSYRLREFGHPIRPTVLLLTADNDRIFMAQENKDRSAILMYRFK